MADVLPSETSDTANEGSAKEGKEFTYPDYDRWEGTRGTRLSITNGTFYGLEC